MDWRFQLETFVGAVDPMILQELRSRKESRAREKATSLRQAV